MLKLIALRQSDDPVGKETGEGQQQNGNLDNQNHEEEQLSQCPGDLEATEVTNDNGDTEVTRENDEATEVTERSQVNGEVSEVKVTEEDEGPEISMEEKQTILQALQFKRSVTEWMYACDTC